MRSVKAIVIVMAAVIALGGLSFAGMDGKCDPMAKCQAKIEALKAASAAVQVSNPELAIGLNEIIAEKEQKLSAMNEMKAKCDAQKKVLRDAAATLQKTDPDLAETLWKMSMKKEQMKYGMKNCPMCKMGPQQS